MSGCSDSIEKLAQALEGAERVVVGAGAGLSAAAGLTYEGERFERYFADFAARYHFRDMYSGGFYRYATAEEHWAYWSRYIFVNRYAQGALPLYHDLAEVLRGKDYFVLTTNVDHCFQKAGFEKTRLFYTQGDYGLWQCAKPCHDKTYDNEAQVRAMVREQKEMRVPGHLVPRYPVCGGPITMNLRSDLSFVEDAGWHDTAQRYVDFLQKAASKKVLFLELGVGSNTPGIIKYPFWEMTRRNPNAAYACVNLGEVSAPQGIADRSICIDGDLAHVIPKIRQDYLQTA